MIHAEPTVHAHDNSDITLSLPMGSPMASKTDPSVSLSSALTHTSNAATPAATPPSLSPAPASLSLAPPQVHAPASECAAVPSIDVSGTLADDS